VMFFVMIVSIILTAASLSRMLDPFTPQRLQMSFQLVAIVALVIGLLGVFRLEPRTKASPASAVRYPLTQIVRAVLSNRQVTLFFVYLILMLAAILGQDVLLEPFAARAFNLPVEATTRITSIWGVFYLVSLLVAGMLEGKIAKVTIARAASWGAIVAFLLITISGLLSSQAVFYSGVVLLGLATGPATVSNLSLMLDMTIPGKVGLFIGAWGAASALARLLGSFTTAVIRDLARFLPDAALYGYGAAFLVQALFLAASLIILRRVNVAAFKREAGEMTFDPSVVERVAISSEA